MTNHNNLPIGVFDSGIGGLSVVKQIMQILPHENIIYFGDIARLPYGTKSVETIRHFTTQTVKFLISQGVKALVIACNTITSITKDTVVNIAKGQNIPVFDVISAGAESVIKNKKRHNIGIIATPVTINSKAYDDAILELDNSLKIFSQECPLFVPLIEEGLIEHPALEAIAKDYLSFFADKDIDTMVLGCTHYPLIIKTIAKILKTNTNIINPAINLCNTLKTTLKTNNLLNNSHHNPSYQFCVTDVPVKFKQIGEQFLGRPMNNIKLVNLDN